MYYAKVKGYSTETIDPEMLDNIEITYTDEGQPCAVIHKGCKYNVHLVANNNCRQAVVYVDGFPFEVELLREVDILVESMGYNQRHNQGHKAVVAPMPGHVLRIEVKEGQKVEKGAKLLTLEAMKMENTVQAVEEGTIKQVFVQEGQTVSKSDLLIEFE